MFFTEVPSLLLAVGLTIYHDNLPGYGMMPGLTYFGEGLFNFGAAIAYALVFFGSVCSCIMSAKK